MRSREHLKRKCRTPRRTTRYVSRPSKKQGNFSKNKSRI